MRQDKRELRQQKRVIKRAGNKRVRRQLKQGLIEQPEDAVDTQGHYGRYRSAEWNGLDRDPERHRMNRA